ncbi:glycosyltransferase family 10 [Fontisphaera persica]|uniref:glycosyltransferase family 10 domain-containing protein n=1 Tax=Fontisphaera persica TaxID=2974023 RepID=UPI0024C0116E|nr:glycosyltransferase family 10 [Fontisphaera persica]WCJ59708.1 glycosyltransferase family 10 [Fontisphaera persica]
MLYIRKIFDALFAGSVPVYLGEERITDYIPSECFVDVRKYKSIKELLLYIKYCPEHEWQRMYDAGQEFIRSEKIRPFTDEAFAERMMEVLKTVAPIE